jgi:phosphinothricin acetyltransferase
MLVRPAEVRDIAAICAIENAAIEETFVNFALEAVSLQERIADFERACGRYPWVVAEIQDAIVGFARGSSWKPKGAYAWTTEIGVYIDSDHRGRGIGRALYQELFPLLESAGLRTILAGIALPNPASVRLHEAFGMRHVGTLPQVGFKHGEWRDVGYWAKHLGEGAPPC